MPINPVLPETRAKTVTRFIQANRGEFTLAIGFVLGMVATLLGGMIR